MPALYTLEIFTPRRLFFSGSVEALTLSLADGEAGVYANCAPFTAPVVPCLLKIRNREGIWKTAFCAEGFIEVTGEKTVIITNAAEWPEEIDYAQAEKAKKESEEILANGLFKFETETASARLRRANMRIKAKNSDQ